MATSVETLKGFTLPPVYRITLTLTSIEGVPLEQNPTKHILAEFDNAKEAHIAYEKLKDENKMMWKRVWHPSKEIPTTYNSYWIKLSKKTSSTEEVAPV